ncbi:MAG: cation diffusion facilitator family transporter [Candidatus Krumholzibacteriia bacterium]
MHTHGNGSDGHGHGHSHGHAHGASRYRRAFVVGLVLNATFVVAEFTAGMLADSLALMADAGHNLGDVLSLALAWGAFLVAERAPSPRFTYRLRKGTVLAALLSSLLLMAALGVIAWEALARLRAPAAVNGPVVLAVAGLGVVINTVTAALFFADRKDDLNIRAAFLHMAADAAVSLGVVAGGLVIMQTGKLWIDPALSLAIVLVIAVGTWGLLRDSLRLALDAAPAGVEPATVESWLLAQAGVAGVHDLHVWAMSTTSAALTAHLVMPQGTDDAGLRVLAGGLERAFGIGHVTLQVERGEGGACPDCGAS